MELFVNSVKIVLFLFCFLFIGGFPLAASYYIGSNVKKSLFVKIFLFTVFLCIYYLCVNILVHIIPKDPGLCSIDGGPPCKPPTFLQTVERGLSIIGMSVVFDCIFFSIGLRKKKKK